MSRKKKKGGAGDELTECKSAVWAQKVILLRQLRQKAPFVSLNVVWVYV